MKHHVARRRTSTLSISLPHELAELVSSRVEGGLYSSASELIREALRMLLKIEDAQRTHSECPTCAAVGPDRESASVRFATTMQLFDLGMGLRALKTAEGDREERSEAGPGLRISPERLERLTLRE